MAKKTEVTETPVETPEERVKVLENMLNRVLNEAVSGGVGKRIITKELYNEIKEVVNRA